MFNIAQLNTKRTYQPEVVQLTLEAIGPRFILIIDQVGLKNTLDEMFLELPNRELSYRGFPYHEQMVEALCDEESTGLVITVDDPVENFELKHFKCHGDGIQTLCRKYKKPIILHMTTTTWGSSKNIEEYADVVLRRDIIFEQTQIECVKNRLVRLK